MNAKKQEELDKQKQALEKKALKNSEKLVQAIQGLTKNLTFKRGTTAPLATKPSEDNGLLSVLKGSFKEQAKKKSESIKALFTKAGALEALAPALGGGMFSAVAMAGAEHLKNKQETKRAKGEFVRGHLEGTESGRRMVSRYGQPEAERRVGERFEQKQTLEKRVAELEQKRKEFKDTGVVGADVTKRELKELETKKAQIEKLSGGKSDKKKQEDSDKAATTAPIAEQLAGSAPVVERLPMQNPEFAAGVKEGMNEELLKLNEDQLEQLKKILQAVTESEEDRLEAKKQQPKGGKEKGEEKDKKKEGSILDKLASLIPALGSIAEIASAFSVAGIAKNIGGKVGGIAKGAGASIAKGAGSLATRALPVVSRALPALGSAAAVAGAGYAGYKAGEALNEYALNPLAETITGQEGATVGSALYDGVQSVKGFFGMETDASKAAAAELAGKQQAQAAMSKQKTDAATKIVLPAEDLATSKAAEVKAAKEYQSASAEEKAEIRKVVGGTEEELDAAFAKLLKNKPIDAAAEKLLVSNGYEVPDYLKLPTAAPEQIAKPVKTQQAGPTKLDAAYESLIMGKPISPEQAELLKKQGQEVPPEQIAKPKSQQINATTAAPTAAKIAPRAELKRILDAKTAEAEEARAQPATKEQPKNITNTNNVVNNSTNTTVVRPDVRITEPSFNRVLSNNFV